MSNRITTILRSSDDPRQVADQLVPLVYDSLHRIAARRVARERSASICATELVHEAYLRIFAGGDVSYENRRHFFAAAAEAMRRVLIDRARSRRTRRRGHGLLLRPPSDQAFHDVISPVDDSVLDPLELDRAVEILETIAPRPALVVKLRYFLGLTIEDTAHVLHLGLTTVKSDWFFARAWLHRFFADDGDEDVPC